MISIVIPTYNRAHLVPRALSSVLAQSFVDWELILVDDGSEDNTEEVVQEFLGDSRIKYLRKENSGSADSRNVGVNHSTGEFLAFLDSDDVWEPNKLEVNVRYINSNPEGICFYSGFRTIDSKSGKQIRKSVPPEGERDLREQLKTSNPIHAFSTAVFPKEVFLQAGGFDIEFKARQDVDLFYRISKISSFVAIPEVLATVYNNQADRISANVSNRFSGFDLFLKRHGHDMSFAQRSFLAKRIVVLAYKNGSYKTLIKRLPLSIFSFVNPFSEIPKENNI